MRLFRSMVIGAVVLPLVLCCVSASLAQESDTRPATIGVSVDIVRDAYGVPHVYSSTADGLFFGYGYAAAEDRLYQLEICKRTALGRVAEVCGPDYLNFDIATRRDGYTIDEIEAQIEALPGYYQGLLEAFAGGINKYIEEAEDNPSKMPKEFLNQGFQPTRWTRAEVIAPFIFTIGFQFMDGFAYGTELYNAKLLDYLESTYGSEQAEGMFNDVVWYDDPLAPVTVPSGYVVTPGALMSAERVPADGWVSNSETPPRSASYMLAISPEKSATGNALLMGGPQFWWTIPGFLMEVGLHGAGFDAVGTSPVGFPFIMFGHSDHHAWSSTYGVGNLVDNYLLTLNPEDPEQYWFDGEWKDLEERTEAIKVKGQADSVQTFYRSIHGPVHTMLPGNQAYARRRAFEGEDLMTWVGYLESSRAADVEEFEEAASKAAYSMNWFYADTEGTIAHFYLGKYPIRPDGVDDRLPTPGTGEYEWLGFHPFTDNPSCINPEEGYLAQWNNRPALGWRNGERENQWASADRVEAIIDLIDDDPSVTVGDVKEVVRRIGLVDPSAKYFKEDLIAAVRTSTSADIRLGAAADHLEAWNDLRSDDDADGKYDAIGQTIYEKWLPTMLANTFGDEYGSQLSYSHPSTNVTTACRMLKHVLEGAESGVPPSIDYLKPLTAKEMMLRSLSEALAALEAQYGAEMSDWKLSTRTLDFVRANFQGIPQSFGDPYKITYQNRGTQNHIVELAEDVQGVNINPPGQSGFVSPTGELSRHYADQLELYQDWDYKPMLLDQAEVEANTESKRRLFYPLEEVSFLDVPPTHGFYSSIKYLAERGIVNGCGSDRFGPDDPLLRAQMAKIVVLALGKHDAAITNIASPSFADVVYTGDPYPFDFVEEAAAQHIAHGYTNGLFGPYDNISRIQMIRMMVRTAGDAMAEPPVGYQTGFVDIPAGDEAVVAKAKFNSLIQGTSATTLDPYSPATRGHVAHIVHRTMLLD